VSDDDDDYYYDDDVVIVDNVFDYLVLDVVVDVAVSFLIKKYYLILSNLYIDLFLFPSISYLCIDLFSLHTQRRLMFFAI